MNYSVVIPNYNGKKLLEKNLRQIIAHVESDDIVVVDDASSDGSIEYLRKHFPRVTLIEKVTNNGFATSVNLGVKAAKHPLVLLLNTDIIPQKGFSKYLVTHFTDEKVFGVGCLDRSVEANGTIVERGRGLGKFERGFLMHRRGDIAKTNTLWVSGGSSMFRKSIWETLGGMDELYNPFYWEDIDLSYRAQKAGYNVLFEPKSIVEHRHEEGSIKKNYSPQEVKTISYRNQFIFVWKNNTDTVLLIYHLFWLPYHTISALLRSDIAFLRGFYRAILQLGQIWEKRSIQQTLDKKKDLEVIQSN